MIWQVSIAKMIIGRGLPRRLNDFSISWIKERKLDRVVINQPSNLKEKKLS